jgi:hypothetical protein
VRIGAVVVTAGQTMVTWMAMMLSRDVETCCSLLRGEYIPTTSLDPEWLEFLRALEVVELKSALDLFGLEVPAEEKTEEAAA